MQKRAGEGKQGYREGVEARFRRNTTSIALAMIPLANKVTLEARLHHIATLTRPVDSKMYRPLTGHTG